MITYKQWCNEPHLEGFSREWDEFLSTPAGAAGMNVLVSRMMSELMQTPPPDARIVDYAAISGTRAEGYRTCLMHLESLRHENIKRSKEQKPAEETVKVDGATLPIPKSVKEQVDKKFRTISRKQ